MRKLLHTVFFGHDKVHDRSIVAVLRDHRRSHADSLSTVVVSENVASKSAKGLNPVAGLSISPYLFGIVPDLHSIGQDFSDLIWRLRYAFRQLLGSPESLINKLVVILNPSRIGWIGRDVAGLEAVNFLICYVFFNI
jgi:hypothetical protein